jgi:hypothetical protein
VRAKAIPGRPSKKGAALQAGLLSQLEAYPDATLAEHCQHWETSKARPGQFRDDESCDPTPGPDQKKTLRASEQKEADRAAWREQAQILDAGKLVFLDECGSTIALTRVYGRSRHQGNVHTVLFHANRRANITLLASLSLQGMGEALIRCRGLRIAPSLRSTWNRFWRRVCTRDKS